MILYDFEQEAVIDHEIVGTGEDRRILLRITAKDAAANLGHVAVSCEMAFAEALTLYGALRSFLRIDPTQVVAVAGTALIPLAEATHDPAQALAVGLSMPQSLIEDHAAVQDANSLSLDPPASEQREEQLAANCRAVGRLASALTNLIAEAEHHYRQDQLEIPQPIRQARELIQKYWSETCVVVPDRPPDAPSVSPASAGSDQW